MLYPSFTAVNLFLMMLTKEKAIERTQMLSIGLKNCGRCKAILPFSEFTIARIEKSGLRTHCKKCVAELAHSKYFAKKEKKVEEYLKTVISQNCNIPINLITKEDVINYQIENPGRICTKCKTPKTDSDFAWNDIKAGRLRTICKICNDLKFGREYGLWTEKQKQRKEFLRLGILECVKCKEIKEVSNFVLLPKKKKLFNGGYQNICKKCFGNEVHEKYVDAKEKLSDFFIKKYAIANYGASFKIMNPDLIETIRLQIIAKQQLNTFHVDGIKFQSKMSFGKYIESNYGVSRNVVWARLLKGHSEEMCKIPIGEFIKITNNGKKNIRNIPVKITNLDTGAVFKFYNLHEVSKSRLISRDTISRRIADGYCAFIIKPYRASLFKNTLKIELL